MKIIQTTLLFASFALIAFIHISRDLVVVVKHQDLFQQGLISLGSPGREGVRDIEENLLYLPSFREVFDGHLLSGDDYLFEKKGKLQPTPLIPKWLGGLLLLVVGGNLDACILLVHLVEVVTFIFLYLLLRTMNLPVRYSIACVTIAIVLGQLSSSPIFMNNFFIKALSLDETAKMMRDFQGRFIAPVLTLPFFLLFLIVLLRDPLLQTRRQSLFVGFSAALNFYVYYANSFVIGMFLMVYLGALYFAHPERRTHYLLTSVSFLIGAIPFFSIYILSKHTLPGDYILKLGMSLITYQTKYHWASIDPHFLHRHFLIYSFLPCALVAAAFFLHTNGPTKQGDKLLARGTVPFGLRSENLTLLLLALLGLISYILPSLLQYFINLPQPSRILNRVGYFVGIIILCPIPYYVFKKLFQPYVQHHPKWRTLKRVAEPAIRAVPMACLLVLTGMTVRAFIIGWNKSYEHLKLKPTYLPVISYFQTIESMTPCVVSTSDVLLAHLVTYSSSCDIVGPNILLSAASIDEAVDRYVAIWVLENQPLNQLLRSFRLNHLNIHDKYREVCFIGGEGDDSLSEQTNHQSDMIALTHHCAPCHPWELRKKIKASYAAYAKDPNKIFEKYRIDYIFSPTDRIHPAIKGIFKASKIQGLYTANDGQ